jgi:hypothetical protein
MRVWPQSSQRSTWPPSAAVRQASIADDAELVVASALATRQASPWRRKTSATSSIGRDMPDALRWRNQLELQGLFFLKMLFADAGYQGRQFQQALDDTLPSITAEIVKPIFNSWG